MLMEKINAFIHNIDKNAEYHRIVRDNLIRVNDRMQQKIQLNTLQLKDSPPFDYFEHMKMEDGSEITREYSTKYMLCRVTYCYPNHETYYWSCCGSRKKNHDPYLEHKEDINYIQCKVKKNK